MKTGGKLECTGLIFRKMNAEKTLVTFIGNVTCFLCAEDCIGQDHCFYWAILLRECDLEHGLLLHFL